MGRPYDVFVDGEWQGRTRDEEEKRVWARQLARDNPGRTIRVVDEWLDEMDYMARVHPETGRLWATGRR